MLGLKNACSTVLFLLLMTWSSNGFSENIQFSNANIKAIENEVINHKNNKSLLHHSSHRCKKHSKLSYYLYVKDFIKSFIEIPTSNVSSNSSTISSKYLAGRAPIYDTRGKKVGTCSASFLCMKNKSGIFTDISNYLSVNNGLIISWLTPTTLRNLELDSIVHSMVTECIVRASTKVGFNPFYGKEFNMIVSSSNKKIYFKLYKI